MKYVIVLGDGMADEPIEALGNQTPLETAKTPMMDQLAKVSEIGQVCNVPKGMSPGSDTANLSVMGYDPKEYYTGRSPLEALSIGVDMKETDVSLRCNIVTLSEEQDTYEDRIIVDHSSGEISTEDCAVLVEALKEGLDLKGYDLYVGTSYRHLLVWHDGDVVELTPPHDILTRRIGEYLPQDKKLRELMEASYEILKDHPINIERKKKGLNPANSAWFWGAGTRPSLTSFEEKTGKSGAMVSAVDLLKGIAVGAGMKNISVEGANGGLHTNYEGKAMAAVHALQDGCDFVYVHVEAPDEMGHQGNVEAKIQAIENLDQRVIRVIVEEMEKAGEDYRMLILPDHPTPIRVRTHTCDPVPYLLFDSTKQAEKDQVYNEKSAAESEIMLENGHQLMDRLLYNQEGKDADS
jgi:2,3-bisphosphoglycerate-independent phosphoglycerate mutase